MFYCKANHLDRGGETQFVEDIRLVTIDRTERNVELVGNFFAKQTRAAGFNDFLLAFGQ